MREQVREAIRVRRRLRERAACLHHGRLCGEERRHGGVRVGTLDAQERLALAYTVAGLDEDLGDAAGDRQEDFGDAVRVHLDLAGRHEVVGRKILRGDGGPFDLTEHRRIGRDDHGAGSRGGRRRRINGAVVARSAARIDRQHRQNNEDMLHGVTLPRMESRV